MKKQVSFSMATRNMELTQECGPNHYAWEQQELNNTKKQKKKKKVIRGGVSMKKSSGGLTVAYA